MVKSRGITAGGAIFERLKALGVDFVFVNSGTDFPPIIEGLAEAAARGTKLPEAIVVPHEHAAMGMAHGYYLMTGRSQAVMLHTNVGLANGAIGAINAACENIPILLMSGRTPTTEERRFGARTVPIGWGQEMRDQAALVRESCKWDYELRFPEQICELIDRAYAIANSTPKGPVYLSLPREVLCEQIQGGETCRQLRMHPFETAANPESIETAADWIACAKAPVIVAQRGAGDRESFAAFSDMVEDWGIPVSSWWATALAIATDHPCHVGADPSGWLAKADLVVVLNSLAPWWPDRHPVPESARVINIGPDPIFSRFPVRNFRSDLTIAGELSLAIPALARALKSRKCSDPAIAQRRQALELHSAAMQRRFEESTRSNSKSGISRELASKVLGDALDGHESTVFSELGAVLGSLKRSAHKSWFQEPHSGGLGWSLPAAMGAKLANPDRLCVATMGDGSYMFANPVACHQIAESLDLPVLAIVFNNEEWGAVRQSVLQLYPDGYASKANRMPLTSLSPTPDYTMVAKASRAWTGSVSEPKDIGEAVFEAIHVVRDQRRQALLEVKVRSG